MMKVMMKVFVNMMVFMSLNYYDPFLSLLVDVFLFNPLGHLLHGTALVLLSMTMASVVVRG